MKNFWPPALREREAWPNLAGGFASVAVAVALYTRYSIYSKLTRDEGIYTYGGQQMAHGVAPYASIVDAKTPGASMVAGLGAAVARVIGRNDVLVIRLVFFACAVLTVLAVYVLAARLWSSVLGGLAAAVVFASFQGFAQDALTGPDAKTPGVLFAVVSMWLAVRRQWFWAAFAGSLAFLFWQPLVIYAVIPVVGAVVLSSGQRWRALALSVAGAAAPLLATVIYFAAEGALGKFYESAFLFPAEGLQRAPETLGHRLQVITGVVRNSYHFSGALFWIGLVLLVAAAVVAVVGGRSDWRAALRDPLILVVVVTLVVEAAYALYDFQGYPDVYPFLPYAAMGFGAAVALAARWLKNPPARRGAAVAVLATAIALTVVSWSWFTNSPANNDALRRQRAAACAIKRIVLPGTSLYSMGDPNPFVLTGERSPDRYIYLGAGVDTWKVNHTKGGFDGWTAQIQAHHPSVVVVGIWRGDYRKPMDDWLTASGYQHGFLGWYGLYVSPQARRLMPSEGVRLTKAATLWPHTAAGTRLTRTNCGRY
jgi:4-amino-4-deoxy-L-arabinose transferase-like glycosyltransferase